MSCRLLILTAGFGEGHNAAARGLAAACDKNWGPGSARIVDPMAFSYPRLAAASRTGYLALVNRRPSVWNLVYRWSDRAASLPLALRLFVRRECRPFAQMISREKPRLICCTYPLHALVLDRLKQSGYPMPPFFNVVTDSISIHSLWWRAGCAGWFLPNEDSAEVLLRAGVPPADVHVTGFPVSLFFAEHTGLLTPPDPAAGQMPRVLHIINSGRRRARETARQLFALPDCAVTCAVGRDKKLQADIAALAAGRCAPASVLGWTDELPRLLLTHNLVVSKAGGATTQESLAAACPMIISQVLPGQEEGNSELLRRHGAGVLAESPEAVANAVRDALARDGELWRQRRQAARKLSRPAAAAVIADHLSRLLVPESVAP